MVQAGDRQPPNAIHPINGPHGGGLAIYVHPSRSHMLYFSCRLYTT